MQKHRVNKLINKGLQLKLSLWLVGVATIAMLFQFAILMSAVNTIGAELPNDSQVFLDRLPEQLLRSFLASLSVSLSVTFVAGILLTSRIAGPIYRFTEFLKAVKEGRQSADCNIRKNDELQELCDLINENTEAKREQTAQRMSEAEEITKLAA